MRTWFHLHLVGLVSVHWFSAHKGILGEEVVSVVGLVSVHWFSAHQGALGRRWSQEFGIQLLFLFSADNGQCLPTSSPYISFPLRRGAKRQLPVHF